MSNLFQSIKKNPASYFTLKEYKKNEMIFNEGEFCKTIGLIIKGKIKITTYTICDQEYVIALLKSDDLFGESLLFSKTPYYMGHIIALEDTTICFIDRKNLITLLQRDAELLENYLALLASKHLSIQERVKLLLQKKIKEAILFYVFEQVKKHHSNTISIPSKEELAQILNIPRPSLSRELIALKKDKWIDYNRHQIILLKKCR